MAENSLRMKNKAVNIGVDNIINLKPKFETITIVGGKDDLKIKEKSSLRMKNNKISLGKQKESELPIGKQLLRNAFDTKNYVGDTLSNIIPSTGNYIKDVVTPFFHPVQTYEGVKTMINGFGELRDRQKYIDANPKKPKPPLTQNMITAEAVNKHFAERYGDWVGNETDDWSVIGNKFLETFRKDPAGVMGDVSGVLSLGTIPFAKYAGKAGKIAQDIAKYSDPIAGLGKATGIGVGKLSSVASGKSFDSLSTAFDAAKSDKWYNPFKSKSNKAFKNAQSGTLSEIDILTELGNKTKLYREQLTSNYNKWADKLPNVNSNNLKTFETISKELDKVKYSGNKPLITRKKTPIEIDTGVLDVKGNPILKPGTKIENIKRVNSDGLTDLSKVEDLINPYLDNIELQTPASLNQLKIELGRLNLGTNKFNNFKKVINTSIKDDLTKFSPDTPRIMDDYSKMSQRLNDLDNIIGGNLVSQSTKTGKITDMFKPTNYGDALKKAEQILGDSSLNKLNNDITSPIFKKIQSDLKPALAGLELRDYFSPNTGKVGLAMFGTNALETATQGSPVAKGVEALLAGEAAILPFTSPRLVGNTSNLLGMANRFGLGTSTGGRAVSLLGNPLASSTNRNYPITEQDIDDINYSLFDNKPYRGL